MDDKLPFAGYWFYGASTATKRASFYCSWGLFGLAPLTGVVMAVKEVYYRKMKNT